MENGVITKHRMDCCNKKTVAIPTKSVPKGKKHRDTEGICFFTVHQSYKKYKRYAMIEKSSVNNIVKDAPIRLNTP